MPRTELFCEVGYDESVQSFQRPHSQARGCGASAPGSVAPGGGFFARRGTWPMTFSDSRPFFSFTTTKLFDGSSWVRMSIVPTSVGSVDMQNSSHILTH